MNGVTIISSTDTYTLAGWQFCVGLLPLIISAVIYFYLLGKSLNNRTPEQKATNTSDFDTKHLLIIFIGGLCSFVLLFCLGRYYPASYVDTQYEIEIADSASFNEVYDKHNIIYEKENTFIVVEREKS